MTNYPLVSIIIPLYNAEKYIADTLQSALSQTWPNIEILVIDDGSTDTSLAIVQQFAHKGVKVASQTNKGAAAARNYGLKIARGDYIQFLDADDLLSPDKIASQIDLLLKHPGKVAICSTIHFKTGQDISSCSSTAYEDSFLYDTDNPAAFLAKLYGAEDNRGSMIQTNTWLSPTGVIKKAGPWSEFYSPDDDGEFFCRVVLASNGIVYAKNGFNYYRKYTDNKNFASAISSEAMHGRFKSFILKKDHLLKAADNSSSRKALAYCAMELAVDSYTIDKKLSEQLLTEVTDLGGIDYIPTLGGPKLELLKKLFGWKMALQIKQLTLKLLGEWK